MTAKPWAGLPGRALGCEVRGARSAEHPCRGARRADLKRPSPERPLGGAGQSKGPAGAAARAGGGRGKWTPESTFETVIQEQTETLYLTSPSGEVFTNPFFLLATCFAVKPSPVAPELPIDGGRSVEVWISPDPHRQHDSPYTYGGNNPVNRFDPDGKDDAGAIVRNMLNFGGYNPRLDPEHSPTEMLEMGKVGRERQEEVTGLFGVGLAAVGLPVALPFTLGSAATAVDRYKEGDITKKGLYFDLTLKIVGTSVGATFDKLGEELEATSSLILKGVGMSYDYLSDLAAGKASELGSEEKEQENH